MSFVSFVELNWSYQGKISKNIQYLGVELIKKKNPSSVEKSDMPQFNFCCKLEWKRELCPAILNF